MIYSKIKAFLGHPLVILSSVGLGVLAGIYAPALSQTLQPIGQSFMSMLELSLLPIIFSAITLSVSNLINFVNCKRYLGHLVITFIIAMILVSGLSTLISIYLAPAKSILEANNPELHAISISASIVDRSSTEAILNGSSNTFLEFIARSIPRNIFHSLTEGETLQVLIFSLLMGIAIAFLPADKRIKTENFLSTLLNIFQRIIVNVVVWLPIAVFAIMATEAASIGAETFLSMSTFVIDAYIVFGVVALCATLVIMKSTGVGFIDVFRNLKTTSFIAFGTRSAIAAIPTMIESLEESFKANKDTTKLLVPFGIVVGRFGNIIYTAFCVVFTAGIYQVELSLGQCGFIVILSIVAGLSATGSTGVLSLSLLTVALTPLQLPLGAVLPLLIAVDAVIDPVRTWILVYVNAAVVIYITKPSREEEMHKQHCSGA